MKRAAMPTDLEHIRVEVDPTTKLGLKSAVAGRISVAAFVRAALRGLAAGQRIDAKTVIKAVEADIAANPPPRSPGRPRLKPKK